MARTYNIFVSHSWKNIDQLIKLRDLLQKRGYFHVQFLEATPDVPINSDRAAYIKKKLKQRIENSDVVLAISGVYATKSYWMNWEIKTANSLNIPIIGVSPRGQIKNSSFVQNYSVDLVNWYTESIVNAIRKHA